MRRSFCILVSLIILAQCRNGNGPEPPPYTLVPYYYKSISTFIDSLSVDGSDSSFLIYASSCNNSTITLPETWLVSFCIYSNFKYLDTLGFDTVLISRTLAPAQSLHWSCKTKLTNARAIEHPGFRISNFTVFEIDTVWNN